MTNVVAAQINSQVLVFVTDSSVRVIEAKVRTVGIHPEPELQGGFKALRDKGLKITNYQEYKP